MSNITWIVYTSFGDCQVVNGLGKILGQGPMGLYKKEKNPDSSPASGAHTDSFASQK